MEKETPETTIGLRLSLSQKEKLQKLAHENYMSMSEYIRMKSLN